MKLRIVLSMLGTFASALWIGGCSQAPLPSFNKTPTPLPTQIPLPTRVAIAVASPTIPNLVSPGGTSDAIVMLRDFIDAVDHGDFGGAMTYWNTSQPGQPSGYDANVRKMVQEWIDKKRQFAIASITYSGLDSSGKYVTMPADDLRVERATARVRIDGIDYQFFLGLLKGGWFIEGVNTAK